MGIVSRIIAFCAVIFFVLQVSAGDASASVQKRKHKAVKHSKLLKAHAKAKKKAVKKVRAKAKKKRKKNLEALRHRPRKMAGRKLASAEAPRKAANRGPASVPQKREYSAVDGEEFFPQSAQNDSGASLLNSGLPDSAPAETLTEPGTSSASSQDGLGDSAVE